MSQRDGTLCVMRLSELSNSKERFFHSVGICANQRRREATCPNLTKDAFDVLRVILPALKVFHRITETFQRLESNIHRVLPEFHNVITKLTKLKGNLCMRAACQAAIDKVGIYMWDFLYNDWICTAFALNPVIKERGLWDMLRDYRTYFARNG